MQKKIYLFKRIISYILIFLFILTLNNYAENDNVNYSTDIIVGENTISSDNAYENYASNEEKDNNIINEDEHSEDTGSIRTSNVENKVSNGEIYTPKSSVQPTSTFSTVATIPEANLTFNNILNAILIGIGIALILFAIAILIRLK